MIVLVQSPITSYPVEWAIINTVYASSSMKKQWEYTVKLVSPQIWIFQLSLPVTIIHVKRIDGTLSA